jgi:hypothetical protein
MKLRLHRYIPICIGAMALMLTQALPAHQAEESTKPETKAEKKAEKKAKKKAKKAAEETGEMTGKAAGSATETTKGMGAARKSVEGTAQSPEMPMTRKSRTTATGSAQRAVPTVSESEIAAAKASGKVWVNTETGVYHKSGRWYGATKQGKFMTEQEAVKAGYRASKK